jgi:uncharacterized OB-fold protein
MSYLPDAMPGPEPTIDDKPFWDFCKAGELRFQRCTQCGRFRHPPGPTCPRCHSFTSEWVRAPDEAELFSFTIVHYSAMPQITPALPYNVAIVRFPSCDDVRIVSNVVEANRDKLRIGMPLSLVFETASNGMRLPRFRPKKLARR